MPAISEKVLPAMTIASQLSELISGLSKTGEMQEAQEALRSVVARIVLQASPETGKLDIILEGALSGLLRAFCA